MSRYVIVLLMLLMSINTSNARENCRCQPHQACWPTQMDWELLDQKLTGRLIQPKTKIQACHQNPSSQACRQALKNNRNPFLLQSTPADNQSLGWYNAWQSAVSPYAVEAKSTDDVIAAVNFARQHHLKIAIKGTGHDYLGRSNAPSSLLIWTHLMRDIKMHKRFIPEGCGKDSQHYPAVTVGAGTRWVEAYTEVTTKNNRYVQGGGCTSVGVAGGFTQGSGFGSFSKKFGTGAASILQVEVVTADGKKHIANQCQNPDLFWAIRGGGGGTFGVVTKMTLKTHELPSNFGVIYGTISATDDKSYKNLIAHIVKFYRESLHNEHWGEQISFHKNNQVKFLLMYQGLSQQQVKAIWQPLKTWLKQDPKHYQLEINMFDIPPKHMWDYAYWRKHHPEFVTEDTHAGAPRGQYWWTPNSGEIWSYWYTYQSWWLPIKLFEPKNSDKLVNVLFESSRLADINLHFNKGLAGASKEAIRQSQPTAIHRGVFDAAALVIILKRQNNFIQNEANKQAITTSVDNVSQAMKYFIQAAPHAGSYANETDYFLKDWQQNLWGKNYQKLYTIKQKYDPNGLFFCHHCVGSEQWDEKGICRR